jgi:hypothetical protein
VHIYMFIISCAKFLPMVYYLNNFKTIGMRQGMDDEFTSFAGSISSPINAAFRILGGVIFDKLGFSSFLYINVVDSLCSILVFIFFSHIKTGFMIGMLLVRVNQAMNVFINSVSMNYLFGKERGVRVYSYFAIHTVLSAFIKNIIDNVENYIGTTTVQVVFAVTNLAMLAVIRKLQ